MSLCFNFSTPFLKHSPGFPFSHSATYFTALPQISVYFHSTSRCLLLSFPWIPWPVPFHIFTAFFRCPPLSCHTPSPQPLHSHLVPKTPLTPPRPLEQCIDILNKCNWTLYADMGLNVFFLFHFILRVSSSHFINYLCVQIYLFLFCMQPVKIFFTAWRQACFVIFLHR